MSSRPLPEGVRKGSAQVQATLRSDYLYRASSGEMSSLWILLHGFEQTGAFMLDKFGDCFPSDAGVLAPNGPFPVPQRRPEGHYRVGYGWYFYDPKSDEYHVGMDAALELLAGLVRELNPDRVPVRILGYSQGGYLGPFAARHLDNVQQLIGVAADFLVDEVLPPAAMKLDWVLGMDDSIVETQGVRAHLAELRFRGFELTEHLIADQGHLISDKIKQAVHGIVAKTSGPR